MGDFLSFIIVAVLAIIVRRMLWEKFQDNRPFWFPYVPREPFLSAAERSFYGVLCAAVPDDRVVLAKIRLADIIQVQRGIRGKQFWKYFNRISGKHVDFVICDRATMDVILCVELDDKSHQGKRQQERDKFVDGALEAAEIRVVRVPCKKAYTAADVPMNLLREPELISEET